MSVFPCSVCGQRRPGKMASAYWAWFLADGSRSAWRMKYCADCAVAELGELFKSLRNPTMPSDSSLCIFCGATSDADGDPIYLTLYLPGRDPEEFAIPADAACAAKYRIPITTQGSRLPDRGGVVRGPSPSTSAWDALGLNPV